ncbi:MAG: signal peptidase II [Chlamydiales bacterium]|nr:signal peptidase II [Chlamydiales bacterium]
MMLFGQGRAAAWIFSLVLFFDQLTKWLTHNYLPVMDKSPYVYPYGGIGIFENVMGIEFSISHLTNLGAAWGAFADFQVYLLILRILLITSLGYYAIFVNRQPRWVLPMALILAGAIGNVIDFFTYGHVVDMIHFILWGYDYPVFNVADSAVFLGVGWIAITMARPQSQNSFQHH